MAATIVLLLQLLATVAVTTVRAECHALKSKVTLLTSEMTNIKEMQMQTQNALQQMQMQMQKGTNETVDNDMVYFTATMPKDTTVKKGKRAIFNNVILNIGNGYDNTTGVFTAPFSGVYEFTLTVYSNKNALWLAIFKAGRAQTSLAAHNWRQASTSIILRVAAGQTVDVRGQRGTDVIHSVAAEDRNYPVFTGKLLMAE